MGVEFHELKPNPTVKITLQFEDGSALTFTLEKPVQQSRTMIWIGKFLAETGNPLDITPAETPLH